MSTKLKLTTPAIFPTATLETISPTEAMEIFVASEGQEQRSMSNAKAKIYAKALREGKWKITGEPIIIGNHGKCLNGQTRLRAVLLSGKNMTTFVVRGIDPAVFPYIDSGKSRTAANVLQIAGYTNTSKLSAAAKFVIAFTRDGFTNTAISKGRGSEITPYEILDAVESNSNLIDFMKTYTTGEFSALSNHKTIHCGMMYGFLYRMWEAKPKLVEEFMLGVSLCENMDRDDPRMALSNRIMSLRTDASNKGTKVTPEAVLSMYIQAWNSFASGKTRKRIDPNYRLLDVTFSPEADAEDDDDE